ncbi:MULTISPECIES: hypothetical protein [Gordonia]|jgi:uncharacterized RDD family membrane protein YckC|uniref:hypothetical protein n=1 Tax=Gordonia TaxID=2053 RepID=UPI001FE2A6D3|nr:MULTISPECIES: hypothetical protein [Gordonia]
MHSEGSERTTRAPAGLIAAIGFFVVGLVAIIVLFVTPLVTDGDTAPTFVYLLTMCAPIGFVLGLIFALRSGRGIR